MTVVMKFTCRVEKDMRLISIKSVSISGKDYDDILLQRKKLEDDMRKDYEYFDVYID